MSSLVVLAFFSSSAFAVVLINAIATALDTTDWEVPFSFTIFVFFLEYIYIYIYIYECLCMQVRVVVCLRCGQWKHTLFTYFHELVHNVACVYFHTKINSLGDSQTMALSVYWSICWCLWIESVHSPGHCPLLVNLESPSHCHWSGTDCTLSCFVPQTAFIVFCDLEILQSHSSIHPAFWLIHDGETVDFPHIIGDRNSMKSTTSLPRWQTQDWSVHVTGTCWFGITTSPFKLGWV